jgi:hypothetical protein
LPELVLVPGHDHTDYQFDHLVPGLAEGGLTPEALAGIRAYERTVFGSDFRLRPEAIPRYLPGTAPEYLGRVTE